MVCDNCGGDGYTYTPPSERVQIDNSAVKKNNPGAGYTSCSSCTSECSLCHDTGYRVEDEPTFSQKRCPACWSWEQCSNCFGTGEYEDGMYDPKAGGVVGGMFECEVCDGKGYIISNWVGNGMPPDNSFAGV